MPAADSTPPLDLPAQLARIEVALAELRRGAVLAAKPILSTVEAMELAGFASESAFYRWAATWGVTNSGAGRWPRQRIEKALHKEAVSATRQRHRADRREEGSAAA